MIGENLVAQVCAVEVEIYLCGSYRFMPKHLLYGTQVGTTVEQMGCKRVSQGVR